MGVIVFYYCSCLSLRESAERTLEDFCSKSSRYSVFTAALFWQINMLTYGEVLLVSNNAAGIVRISSCKVWAEVEVCRKRVIVLEETWRYGCFCGSTNIEQRMQSDLPWERPHPTPLILLPSLKTGLLLHVLVVCGSDDSSNLFYYECNCLHAGIEENSCINNCFNFDIDWTTRAEGQFIPALLHSQYEMYHFFCSTLG